MPYCSLLSVKVYKVLFDETLAKQNEDQSFNRTLPQPLCDIRKIQLKIMTQPLLGSVPLRDQPPYDADWAVMQAKPLFRSHR
jgi:hypothetical protein